MTKIRKLKEQALEACQFRRHNMDRFFEVINEFKEHRVFISTCKNCGAGVVVNLNPAPNEIDIAGSAVAIYCKNQ